MTEENYNYRTSPLLLRNQFAGTSKFQMPVVPKFKQKEGDFTDLKLIGFDKTNLETNHHLDRMVHFFLYDYKFERIFKNPDTDLEKLKRYRAVLTPDFSMYTEMAPVMQLYNTFRNRWCGAYFASKGLRVIPTVSWGNENTFDFCFDGIEKGSTVAVSTYMVSERNNHSDQKEFFLKGYNEMLKKIEPEKIICYHEPFSEMRGDIVFVDHTLSSWRYMNDDQKDYVPSKYAEYLCGRLPLPENSGIIIKRSGYVLPEHDRGKGMGSAYGGKWKPGKPEDERFLGKPGEVKTTYDKNGEKIQTKIGNDGRATKERHHSVHNRADKHSNPHDHNIDWNPNRGNPLPGPPINYLDGNIPEFKYFSGVDFMSIVHTNSFEDDRFKTISEFKWCVNDGGEVIFEYNNKMYSITHPDGIISICEENNYNEAVDCLSADEVLEYTMDGKKLRDIITEVKVMFRTI